MPSAVYSNGAEAILDGTVNLEGDNIKCALIDLDDYGIAVEGASNATPIVITATGHGLANGAKVLVARVGGNTNANGVWIVANQTANTFELQGSAGNGAFTSGGRIIELDGDEFLGDIPSGARVALSANLGSKTFTNGRFDAADTVFTGADGDPCEAWVTFEDTGNPATSRLLSITDRTAAGAAFAVDPNGGDVNLQFSASGIFTIATPVGQQA